MFVTFGLVIYFYLVLLVGCVRISGDLKRGMVNFWLKSAKIEKNQPEFDRVFVRNIHSTFMFCGRLRMQHTFFHSAVYKKI